MYHPADARQGIATPRNSPSENLKKRMRHLRLMRASVPAFGMRK